MGAEDTQTMIHENLRKQFSPICCPTARRDRTFRIAALCQTQQNQACLHVHMHTVTFVFHSELGLPVRSLNVTILAMQQCLRHTYGCLLLGRQALGSLVACQHAAS